MTPEERSNLAALHALSLLEGEEALLALRMEATDPEFAAEVAEFAGTCGSLADSIVPMQPSGILRERVMGLANPKMVSARPSSSWSRIGWAAAAMLALSTVWFWSENRSSNAARQRLTGELETFRERGQLAGLRIANLEGQLEGFKGTRAVVIWNQSLNEGRIDLTNLPPAEAGKDYQLWIVDPAYKNPVNGGLIHREPDGSARVPFQPVSIIGEAAAFAISVEKAGGVEVGQGPIVVMGK